ncbi:poly(R)-hydroxyalkanoic acid synthase subunit PhaE [Piscinibacter sp. XHJ-5]|uniref:poly(R)-hydroxyalkanoic acid synthase subunit PhaE n=1 Tax=Piscinibacter sp. XHJ-5 TaxID=3037797 RepID=UPI002453079C|nr:poly(R)-hydroxyalkanoic acid synthase subunit PhaE [Piscinibacter sp. XHJ-5]
MSEPTTHMGQDWIAAQQAMLKAFFPWASAQAPAAAGIHASPLEQQFGELRDTWQASVARWTAFAKDAPAGKLPTPETLREMFAPASWTGAGHGVLDAALQRVLEGPRYAMLWDHDRQLLELQRLTLERDKAVAAYQAVVHKAWGQISRRFTKTLNADPQAGPTWRTLVDRWLAVANDTLIEVHRSDEFVQAQRRMLRSASDRHLQERRIAEAWCEAAHIPTRSEVDELQRLVTELRREVRLLRRGSTAAAEPAARRPRAAAKRKSA